MPYIAIKAYPRDRAAEQRVVEQINELLIREWGCRPQAVSISMEEVQPADWEEKIANGEIKKNKEHMMILSGKKMY